MNYLMLLLLFCGVAMIAYTGCVTGLTRVKRMDFEKDTVKPNADPVPLTQTQSSVAPENAETTEKLKNNHEDKNTKNADTSSEKPMPNFKDIKERIIAKNRSRGRKLNQGFRGISAIKNGKMHSSGIMAPITTYVLREQEYPNPSGHAAKEFLVIDNTPKHILEEVNHNFLVGNGEPNMRNNQQRFLTSELGTVGPATQVIIPPNKLGMSRYKSTLEQMFHLADMLLYKAAKDAAPLRTQSASLTLMPLNSITPGEEEPKAIDYFYNGVETPTAYGRPPMMVPNAPTMPGAFGSQQSPGVFYGPPLVFKQPIPSNDHNNILNIIEHAISTLMVGNGQDSDTEDEIELHCPIHHGKKNGGRTGEPGDDGVVHICSCRLIKKKKNVKKQAGKHGQKNIHLNGVTTPLP